MIVAVAAVVIVIVADAIVVVSLIIVIVIVMFILFDTVFSFVTVINVVEINQCHCHCCRYCHKELVIVTCHGQ